MIAIIGADVHLSHTKPFYRSPEPEWYESQADIMDQVCHACCHWECPFIVAGDLFDRWSVNPELITFAMRFLPKQTYVIPGQHDLPNHDMSQIHRSGMGVLVESGRVRLMEKVFHLPDSVDVLVHPFPWGSPVTKLTKRTQNTHIAVSHQYAHNGSRKTHYAGAGESDDVTEGKMGYDATFYGDNHIPWNTGRHFNCGAMITRHASDRHHRRGVFVILDDEQRSVCRAWLDQEGEQVVDVDQVLECVETGSDLGLDITQVGAALAALWGDGLDFISSIRNFCKENNVTDDVSKRIMEAVDNARSRTKR